jgi:hypothetical protein
MIKIIQIIFSIVLSCRGETSDFTRDDICASKMCLLDAKRLINAASTDSDVQPCDDFKEFAIGNFLRHDALHDRYDRIGFLYDTLTAYYTRQRKLLLENIQPNESLITKIVKSFFQKCIDRGKCD